jgi:Capsule polysaccharide export protein
MSNILLLIGTGHFGEDVLQKVPWARHLDLSNNRIYTISRIDPNIYSEQSLINYYGAEFCSIFKASLNELDNISEIFSIIYSSPFFKKQYQISDIEALQSWLGISFKYIASFDRRFFNKKLMKDSRNEAELYNYIAALIDYYRDFYTKYNIQFLINTLEDSLFSVAAYYTAKRLGIRIIGFMSGRFPKRGIMFCEDFRELCVWNDEKVEWKTINLLYDDSTIAGDETLSRNRQYFDIKSLINNASRIKYVYNYNIFRKYVINCFYYEKFICQSTTTVSEICLYILKLIRSHMIELISDKPSINDKYFLFPLHYENDAQITFREPLVNQLELIRNISRSLPYGYFLYIKPHPHYLGTDFCFKDLLNISKLNNVKLLNPTIPPIPLLKRSRGVFTINSTTGFEALIEDIPVITFGHEFYCKDNLTYIVRDIGKLSKTLLDVVNNGNKSRRNDVHQFVKTVYSNTIWINPIINPHNIFIISDADGKKIAIALNSIFKA